MSGERGDINDVKDAFATILAGPKFLAALEAAVQAKQDGVMPSMRDEVVLPHETLTQVQFPVCELVGFGTHYSSDMQVKQGLHRVGARWTVVEASEAVATRSVELLCRATVDVLWDDAGTLSGDLADFQINAGPITVTDEDYSPLVPTAEKTFQKSGLVMFEVSTWRS